MDPEHAGEYSVVLVIDIYVPGDEDLFPRDPRAPQMTKGPIQ